MSSEEHAPSPQSDPSGRAHLYRLDPASAGDFARLAYELTGVRESSVLGPLQRILEVAGLNGCQTVLVEEQYSDADYHSEYSAFWSQRHEQRTRDAKRLHFFAEQIAVEQLAALPPSNECRYLGYSVLRPSRLGPVGRTVMLPPPSMRTANLCKVAERPSVFGAEMSIEGVPFCQQDGELLRCAHAVAWLCHYAAWSRDVIARRLTADIARLPMADRSKHRPFPSSGLTAEQLQGVFSAVGIPAFFYDVEDLPEPPAPFDPSNARGPGKPSGWRGHARGRRREHADEDLEREKRLRIACKYLNSGFPVVVFTSGAEENHAFTLVGWQDAPTGPRLIACDDQVGPYELIEDVLAADDVRGAWTAIMIPLPERVHLNGEAAETRARDLALAEAELESDASGEGTDRQGVDFAQIAPQLQYLRKGISIRSRLLRGRELKDTIATKQGRQGDALRLYRMAPLPQWVWLVEFQDTAARGRGEPCVVAEIVFDSTSHDLLPVTLLTATRNESKDNALFREHGPKDFCLASGPRAGEMWTSVINPPLPAPAETAEGPAAVESA